MERVLSCHGEAHFAQRRRSKFCGAALRACRVETRLDACFQHGSCIDKVSTRQARVPAPRGFFDPAGSRVVSTFREEKPARLPAQQAGQPAPHDGCHKRASHLVLAAEVGNEIVRSHRWRDRRADCCKCISRRGFARFGCMSSRSVSVASHHHRAARLPYESGPHATLLRRRGDAEISRVGPSRLLAKFPTFAAAGRIWSNGGEKYPFFLNLTGLLRHPWFTFAKRWS